MAERFSQKNLIKKLCINGCTITVKWFSIFFWAKISFFCIIQTIILNLIFGKWMNYLEMWFRSVFSASRRVSPSKWVIHLCLTLHLENLKLRNWCFYCVKTLSDLGLMILRCICNKGVRSRQEYINCFQLLTF